MTDEDFSEFVDEFIVSLSTGSNAQIVKSIIQACKGSLQDLTYKDAQAVKNSLLTIANAKRKEEEATRKNKKSKNSLNSKSVGRHDTTDYGDIDY